MNGKFQRPFQVQRWVPILACLVLLMLMGGMVCPGERFDLSTMSVDFGVHQVFNQPLTQVNATFQLPDGGRVKFGTGRGISVNSIPLPATEGIFGGIFYTEFVPRQDPPDGIFTFTFSEDFNSTDFSIIPPEPVQITNITDSQQVDALQPLQVDWALTDEIDSNNFLSLQVVGVSMENPESLTQIDFDLDEDNGTFTVTGMDVFAAGEGGIFLTRLRTAPITKLVREGRFRLEQLHEVPIMITRQ